MNKTLVNKSNILYKKYSFFASRILAYILMLFIPFKIDFIAQASPAGQFLVLIFYILFISGQWYLLGKEVDYRFKIYYKANSTIERILYRLISGIVLTIILFNIFSVFPLFYEKVLFWTFYAFMGLYYSWPTRGKIIEESMSSQFGEYRFLDSFEKTVLLLTLIMFVVSLPEIPLFNNIEALKLYLDPQENIHYFIWNFLRVSYIPFIEKDILFNLAWNFHIYILGLGIYLMSFYALLRMFFGRRLSILGAFAIVSTWSLPLILESKLAYSFTSTFTLLWIWSVIWAIKSQTYRSGLFTGLVLAYGTMINIQFIYLMPFSLALVYYQFLKDKTLWYRKQWLKYNLLGVGLCLVVIFSQWELGRVFSGMGLGGAIDLSLTYIQRKAFYTLAIIGLILLALRKIKPIERHLSFFSLNFPLLREVSVLFLLVLFLGSVINPIYLQGFSLLWVCAFLSLIPIEWIFQSIQRLRSKRNIIFVLYILVCLLDSHFEGRVRNLSKMLARPVENQVIE